MTPGILMRLPSHWRSACAYALAYTLFAAATLRLTQGAHGIATLWPGSGILLASIILLPRPSAWLALGLSALGSLAANIDAGIPLPLASAFTTANAVEALTGATFWRLLGCKHSLFLDGKDVARFGVTAVGATFCSTFCAWLLSGTPGGFFAVSWFATVLLGLLIVTPALIVFSGLRMSDAAVPRAPPLTVQIGAMLLGLAAVTGLVFWQSTYPLLFVPLIALLAITHRMGVLGASMGVLVIAIAASSLSFVGHGPVMLMQASLTERSVFLQLYLLALFATALPLAALLASRERLAGACRLSERMHRLLSEASGDIVVRFALDGTPLYVSPACRHVLNYSPDGMLARGAIRDIHPEDRPDVLETWSRVVRGAVSETCTYRQRAGDGREIWLEAAYRFASEGATGGRPEIVATVRDVTRRRLAEIASDEAARELRQANEMLAEAEAVAQLGHWRVNLVSGAVTWSAEVVRIHDYPGRVPRDAEEALLLYHPDDQRHVRHRFLAAIGSGGAFSFEARIVTGSGQVRHVVSKGVVKPGSDGSPGEVFGTLQDVTEWVEIEQELERARKIAEDAAASALRLADTDALTGCASRRRIIAALEEGFAVASRNARGLSVAVLDVDHFKRVNDGYGHSVGDAVLKQVAHLISDSLRAGDLLGRLGGEEFVVVSAASGSDQALAMADRLRLAVSDGFARQSQMPAVTVSIGVAVVGRQDSAADLLAEADIALYAAKSSGRNVCKLAA